MSELEDLQTLSNLRNPEVVGLRDQLATEREAMICAYSKGVSAGRQEALQYTKEERERYGKWVEQDNLFKKKNLELATEREAREKAEAEVEKLKQQLDAMQQDMKRFTADGLLDVHAICDQRDELRKQLDEANALTYSGAEQLQTKVRVFVDLPEGVRVKIRGTMADVHAAIAAHRARIEKEKA